MKWMDEYNRDLAALDQVIDHSLVVSNLIEDIPIPERLNYAHRLYSRLLLTSLSLIRLCPFSRMHVDGEIWDFFSIANITRCSMENYAVFHYLSEDVDAEEDDFRVRLLYFHKNTELFKYYKDLATPEEELKKLNFDKLPEDKERLKAHPFMKRITNQRRKDDILNGNTSMVKKHTEILNEIKLKNIPFKAKYRFYSNQAHSTPLSYFTMDNERGRGERNEAEVTYITWAIDITRTLLVSSTHHVMLLIPETKNRVPSETVKYFEEEYKKLLST